MLLSFFYPSLPGAPGFSCAFKTCFLANPPYWYFNYFQDAVWLHPVLFSENSVGVVSREPLQAVPSSCPSVTPANSIFFSRSQASTVLESLWVNPAAAVISAMHIACFFFRKIQHIVPFYLRRPRLRNFPFLPPSPVSPPRFLVRWCFRTFFSRRFSRGQLRAAVNVQFESQSFPTVGSYHWKKETDFPFGFLPSFCPLRFCVPKRGF